MADEDWAMTNKDIDNEKLFNAVKEAIMSGKLKARDYYRENVYYTPAQVKGMLTRLDTLFTEDKATGKMTLQVIDMSITGKDISIVKTKEQWNWNPATLMLEKKVIGMSFHIYYRSEDGQVKGLKPLFYVPLAEQVKKEK